MEKNNLGCAWEDFLKFFFFYGLLLVCCFFLILEHVALGICAHWNSASVRNSTGTQEFSSETGTANAWYRKWKETGIRILIYWEKKPKPNYFMSNITSCSITDKQYLIQIYQLNSFINCFKFGIRHEGYTQWVWKKSKVILNLTRRWFGAVSLCEERARAALSWMQLGPAHSTVDPWQTQLRPSAKLVVPLW